MNRFTFPIEAGHIMMFARALGDPNPAFHHGASSGQSDSLAPPTFAIAAAQYAPNYPMRPRVGEPWFGSGGTPSGAERTSGSGTGLHAEEHFEYLRPVRAGDVLSVSSHPGGTWTKEGRRGGTLTFTERITEFRDPDGELVIRERSVFVRTGQTVEHEQGEGRR